MALADPQSIKISGVTTSLPRVSTGDFKSVYESADGLIKLSLSTDENRRKRQVARLDVSKITTDPFIPAQNVEVSMSIYLVFDRPKVGYTNAEAKAVYDGLIEAFQATSSVLITKLLGSES
ncbi:coat protein [ssRNA phage Zoerhiza.2_9]|uniref:Coat protein n=2 Tax=Leviviricetes TaxID=2842243 RepID=A0A8S5L479_9VIRU|nr:coat protein [ssRNA phage Zoerhiza.2_9]QDH88878.1 MAG: hypothetical protein H2Rhizo31617_000002 [Leviviridae sp.]DAD52220.1 TPA_asm: coat protein [ssRNA phage Zoerhiza.2_9]